MPQINLSLLKTDVENYPWRARGATLKQIHESYVVLIQVTTYFVRCKINITTIHISGIKFSHYIVQMVHTPLQGLHKIDRCNTLHKFLHYLQDR